MICWSQKPLLPRGKSGKPTRFFFWVSILKNVVTKSDSVDAVFLDDDQFYAAMIMDGPDEEGQYLVVFVDYGNEQWTPSELIREGTLEEAEGLKEVVPVAGGGASDDSAIFSVLEPAEDPFGE